MLEVQDLSIGLFIAGGARHEKTLARKRRTCGSAPLIAGPAIAADMPVEKAPPPAPVAYYDWSGAYIGFNAGGVWHKNSLHFPTPGAAGT